MPGHATHWERQVGDGIVYGGPCIVKTLVFYPHADTQYADVYDGRDATSGTKFARLAIFATQTQHYNLGDGVYFGRGIYIDAEHADDEVTVTFIPL